MMFLLRAAFWLCVVILFLPADPDRPADAPSVTVVEAFMAARATVADLALFCDRNPDVCATGEAVVDVMVDKASYGIEQIQGYLAEGTLTEDDVEVPWQGDEEAVAAID